MRGDFAEVGRWHERTGAPWRDLPDRHGPWKTAHERLRKWTADGTWDRGPGARDRQRRLSLGPLEDSVEFVISVYSTSVRAHQHTAGARKGGCARTGSKTSPSTGNPSGSSASSHSRTCRHSTTAL
ncbi:putative transposase [Amycolatopsis decaplanina DSM 44594]|uniref:Putative transposase n=1 Tax=Amycolatopsis decaplanina DSM 44594 TaxID=1284240 RepID=M2WUT9_9PSEU|nr:putative transposase [Amycolatopsis decaplanina DSM 44594]